MPFPQRVRILFGSLSPSKFGDKISSFADPGCLSRNLDPGSEFFSIPNPRSWIQILSILDPWSRIWIFSIPDVGSQIRINEFKYFCQEKWFLSSQKYDPGFPSRIRIWFLTFYLSRIPILDPRSQIQGSKKHRIPDPGSWIRIRSTVDFGFAQAIGGSVGYWLSTGAAHSMDQLSEAFMCKKEFSIYFIFTLSSYDALRICFLTHLVRYPRSPSL